MLKVAMLLSVLSLSLCKFATLVVTDDFYWSLSDSKSLQLPRTLLSILVDLSSIMVWTVWILFSRSFWDCSKDTIYDWYHCHLHFFKKVQLFRLFLIFLYFYSDLQEQQWLTNSVITTTTSWFYGMSTLVELSNAEISSFLFCQ